MIGDKYRTHKSPDNYLAHSISKAQGMSDLTEEERQNPVFIAGAVQKKKNSYSLKSVALQEFISRKYFIKYIEKENAVYGYNSKCYEELRDGRGF